MNRLRHLFIILKPEFQGEGISLLPWSFNSLKMPLTQVVTIGTYSQLEKMEPPTISALSSSWCIFVGKCPDANHFMNASIWFFENQRGDSCGEKTCSWNVKHFTKKQRKTHGFGAASTQKKNNKSFSKKNKVSFQGFNPNIQKSSNPFSWMFPPF